MALAAGVAAWLALRFDVALPVAIPPQPVALEAPAPEASPSETAEAVVAPPVFDVVRVAADGGALVAGRAAPGAEVVLRVDDGVVARTLADPSGQFVAMFELGTSEVPQVLTLSAALGDGTVLAASDVVVLGPRGGAAAVAEAPAADAAPVAEAAAPAPEGAAPLADMAAAGSGSAPALVAPEPPPVEIAAGTPELAAGPATEPAPEPVPETVAEAAPAATPESASEPAPPPQAVAAEAAAPPVELAAVAEPDPAPPAAFVVEAGGGVRLLDRAPQVLDNVVVDAIGYGPEGDVQISGRTRQIESGTPLRVYLNNEPVALARSDGADWRLDLPQVDPGVYTLRVDELAPDGRVVSRFETPFLREDPATVARLFGTAAPALAEAEPAPGPLAVLRPQTEAPAETPAQPPAESHAIAAAPEPALQSAPEPARPVATVAQPEAATAQAAPTGAPPAPRVLLVTVQPGHTLWRLSREHYGEGTRYLQIYRANRAQIRDPDLIYPGQIFSIPD